ncbi:MAG: TonB family protein [Rhizomicrobium sp.]
MKRAIALVLLLPSIALAQTTASSQGAATTSPSVAITTPAAGPATAPPAAIGNAPICSIDIYSPAALAAGEQGSVALSFRIGTDGSPKNVTVSATSGYPDLDQAAVACAAQWKYRPAMQDGRPVEVDWKAIVKYSMAPSINPPSVITDDSNPTAVAQGRSPAGTPKAIANAHNCASKFYPPAAIAGHEEGDVGIAFLVATDGSTEKILVYSTSGYPDLDQAALTCAAQWKYRPATQNGKPVEWSLAETVHWTLHAQPLNSIWTAVNWNTTNPAQMQQPVDSQICKSPLTPSAQPGRSTTITFWVMQDGSLENLRLMRSSGDDALDRYGLSCVGQWRFTVWTGSARERRLMRVTLYW